MNRSLFPNKYPLAHVHSQCCRGDARYLDVSKRVTVVQRDGATVGVDRFVYEARRVRISLSHTKFDYLYMYIKTGNLITETTGGANTVL